MSKIKYIPVTYKGGSVFNVKMSLMHDKDVGQEFVVILKSDVDRFNETEKWRQLQNWMMQGGAKEAALVHDCVATHSGEGKITFPTSQP